MGNAALAITAIVAIVWFAYWRSRPRGEQGNLSAPANPHYGPPGRHYYRRLESNGRNSPVTVEHFMVVLAVNSRICFSAVSNAPPGLRPQVLSEYSKGLLAQLLQGYLYFSSQSLVGPVGMCWVTQLPAPHSLALAVALSHIPDSQRGRVTVHTGRLVFKWSRYLETVPTSQQVDAILSAAEQRLASAVAALDSPAE